MFHLYNLYIKFSVGIVKFFIEMTQFSNNELALLFWINNLHPVGIRRLCARNIIYGAAVLNVGCIVHL